LQVSVLGRASRAALAINGLVVDNPSPATWPRSHFGRMFEGRRGRVGVFVSDLGPGDGAPYIRRPFARRDPPACSPAWFGHKDGAIAFAYRAGDPERGDLADSDDDEGARPSVAAQVGGRARMIKVAKGVRSCRGGRTSPGSI